MVASEYHSTERLAAVTGVSKKTLDNVIGGRTKPRLKTVKLLASAFDVDAADLLEEIRTWQEARA